VGPAAVPVALPLREDEDALTLSFRCRTCRYVETSEVDKPVLTGWVCPGCGPGHIYTVTQGNGMYSRIDEMVSEAKPKPVECACSTRTLMRKGCPKRRGGVCEQ
jgi:hypothetical protein